MASFEPLVTASAVARHDLEVSVHLGVSVSSLS
jgi:hypothetical protein